MGGVVGIFMIGFGILWTVLVAQANVFFALFGVLWTGIAVVNTVYNFKNATGKNRYSAYDITEEHEESDPLCDRFGQQNAAEESPKSAPKRFCPYCGAAIADGYVFCHYCGRKLP